MDASRIERHFPAAIPFPEELRKLCEWHEEHGDPISGDFALLADDHHAVSHWFGSDAAVGRLAVFGSGPDGSLYAIWLQDSGEYRVVHLGSEGQNNFVLARDMREFLQLLAIGYAELGFDDLSLPPEAEGVNPDFQQWLASEFGVAIPVVGERIVQSARADSQDFDAWARQLVS